VQRFQLVFFDAEGRPQAYYSVDCESDVEAARQARATGYRNEIEVRDGDTVVRRLNSRNLQAEPAPGLRPAWQPQELVPATASGRT
jgi:hypothetical protein